MNAGCTIGAQLIDFVSPCEFQTCVDRLVGSRTGAVPRRCPLGCVRRFQLRARLGVTVGSSPAPAR